MLLFEAACVISQPCVTLLLGRDTTNLQAAAPELWGSVPTNYATLLATQSQDKRIV
jgi:hypothetical protein